MNACKVLELASKNSIDEIIRLAKLGIKEQEIKRTVGNEELKRYKAAHKYIKKINNFQLKGTWEENGKQCFSNGYTAFILNNKIDDLPNIKNDMNIHSITGNTENYIEIDVNIKEIKADLKIQKAQSKQSCYYCDVGISRYNIEFLINCYDILGGNIVFKQSSNNELAFAKMESENGIAILLPVRKLKQEAA